MLSTDTVGRFGFLTTVNVGHRPSMLFAEDLHNDDVCLLVLLASQGKLRPVPHYRLVHVYI